MDPMVQVTTIPTKIRGTITACAERKKLNKTTAEIKIDRNKNTFNSEETSLAITERI